MIRLFLGFHLSVRTLNQHFKSIRIGVQFLGDGFQWFAGFSFDGFNKLQSETGVRISSQISIRKKFGPEGLNCASTIM